MSQYTPEVLQKAVATAKTAARDHAVGCASYTSGGQTFDLDAGGWCLRFVRQCFETALSIGSQDWEFASPSAKISLGMMDRAGLNIGRWSNPVPGDILGMQFNAGTFGHIMLNVGHGLVAENTSAGNRGTPRKPGTKLTPLSDVWERVQGVYRLGEYAGWQKTDPVKVVLQDGDAYRLLLDDAKFDGNQVTAGVRKLAEALGYTVTAHLDQGKVYVSPTTGGA